MELEYKIKRYGWGKKGEESIVATLYQNTEPSFKIDPNETYAELWLGTHINGCSHLKDTQESLQDAIEKQPSYLGEKVIQQFGGQLPFLFKVLSIDKALSIQAHPTKEHARQLNLQRPDLYKDANHKPELAIALTPFEALCGFRPVAEIYYFLQCIPELRNLVGSNILAAYNNRNIDSTNLLKEAFKAVLTSSRELVVSELRKMIARFKTLDEQKKRPQLGELVEKLYSQHPDDVGCFMVYFLNFIQLSPFESIYLPANEPHAYIHGDCVECMACSDNVVRAGLTPKYIDVETICSMLVYKGDTAESKIFRPQLEDDNIQVYRPPLPDFAVAQITILPSDDTPVLQPRPSASTLMVITGYARSGLLELKPGIAIFLPADQPFPIEDVESELLIFQAFANV